MPLFDHPQDTRHDMRELQRAAPAHDDVLRNGAPPRVWRSLEEYAGSLPDDFEARVRQEFPVLAEHWSDEPSRRRFLQVMAASFGLAGLSGCVEQPAELIVPFVEPPPTLIPGEPLYYATAFSLDGEATGLLATSRMGRPVKLDGNPQHPGTPPIMADAPDPLPHQRPRLGASSAFAQAAVLGLYDPERSQSVRRGGQLRTWDAFTETSNAQLAELRRQSGRGLRLLTGAVISPAIYAQIENLLSEYPQAQWHRYEPLHDDNALAGARRAFGDVLLPQVDVSRCAVVVSLDSDFLSCGPGALGNLHALARRRAEMIRTTPDADSAFRLYAIESSCSVTGAAADRRIGLSPDGVARFAWALAETLAAENDAPTGDAALGAGDKEWPADFFDQLVHDLTEARGRSAIVVGRWQSPEVHALVHLLNHRLGNANQTVNYRAPAEYQPVSHLESLQDLAGAIDRGEVEYLAILGGNPAFDAPADVDFSERLARVPFSVHLSPYYDETSRSCEWHVPQRHFLESWGDTRSAVGAAAIVQPLIAPLYAGKTDSEMLAALRGDTDADCYDLVRNHWLSVHGESDAADDFETFWNRALHDGVIEAASMPSDPSATLQIELADLERPSAEEAAEPGELTLLFRPDPAVWDGRFANNAWLQELPRPLTSLTWDNALLVAPSTADEMNLAAGDVVELQNAGGQVTAPVLVLPGHPTGCGTLHVGYGRRDAGTVGDGVGANAYLLRTVAGMWSATVEVRRTGQSHRLALTQHHHLMEGRDLVRRGTLEALQEHPEHPPFMTHHHAPAADETLYPPKEYDGNKWGMVIDLSRCVGCQACVVACQAENNIPVVGRDEVLRGREMHWLRVDHYFVGEPDNPAHAHQPVPCMHCELAPCEPVCPVAATTHSDDGLNEMTYNRCVGTRYCSNNCPYKVRRFNFLDYNEPIQQHDSLQLLANPEVTVRSRGVMEKCTYCVQRISAARIDAGRRSQPIRDGEVITACQAACPAEAITFGDLNDEASRAAALASDPLNYALLAELNTRPRTTYLAAIRNPGADESAGGEA